MISELMSSLTRGSGPSTLLSTLRSSADPVSPSLPSRRAPGEVPLEEARGHVEMVRPVKRRALVAGASENEHGRLGAGANKCVVQRRALRDRCHPIVVAVCDEEGWCCLVDAIQGAGGSRHVSVSGEFIDSEKRPFEGWTQDLLL